MRLAVSQNTWWSVDDTRAALHTSESNTTVVWYERQTMSFVEQEQETHRLMNGTHWYFVGWWKGDSVVWWAGHPNILSFWWTGHPKILTFYEPDTPVILLWWEHVVWWAVHTIFEYWRELNRVCTLVFSPRARGPLELRLAQAQAPKIRLGKLEVGYKG